MFSNASLRKGKCVLKHVNYVNILKNYIILIRLLLTNLVFPKCINAYERKGR